MVNWPWQRTKRIEAPKLRARSAELAARKVDLAELTPGLLHFLGQAAYLQLALFENLSRAVSNAPTAEAKDTLSHVAALSLTKHHGLTDLIRRHGSQPGPVGVVAQSGAISGAIVNRLGRMGVGIRTLITTGNECDITAADALEWFAQDDTTTTIVCYLEQIREPDLVDPFVPSEPGQNLPLGTGQAEAAGLVVEAPAQQTRRVVQEKAETVAGSGCGVHGQHIISVLTICKRMGPIRLGRECRGNPCSCARIGCRERARRAIS